MPLGTSKAAAALGALELWQAPPARRKCRVRDAEGGSLHVSDFVPTEGHVAVHIMDEPGPSILAYADVLFGRIGSKAARSSVLLIVHRISWRNAVSLIVADLLTSPKDTSASVAAMHQTIADDEQLVGGCHMWQVIDGILVRSAEEQQRQEKGLLTGQGAPLSQTSGSAGEDKEDSALWYEFWELYRDKGVAMQSAAIPSRASTPGANSATGATGVGTRPITPPGLPTVPEPGAVPRCARGSVAVPNSGMVSRGPSPSPAGGPRQSLCPTPEAKEAMSTDAAMQPSSTEKNAAPEVQKPAGPAPPKVGPRSGINLDHRPKRLRGKVPGEQKEPPTPRDNLSALSRLILKEVDKFDEFDKAVASANNTANCKARKKSLRRSFAGSLCFPEEVKSTRPSGSSASLSAEDDVTSPSNGRHSRLDVPLPDRRSVFLSNDTVASGGDSETSVGLEGSREMPTASEDSGAIRRQAVDPSSLSASASRARQLANTSRRLTGFVHDINMACDGAKPAKKAPVFRFKGFDDYKQRQYFAEVGAADIDSQKVLTAVTNEPQWKWPVAVQEHKKAQDFRLRAEMQLGDEASRGRPSTRDKQHTPNSCFHRPWSRERAERISTAVVVGAVTPRPESPVVGALPLPPPYGLAGATSQPLQGFSPIHRFAKVCLATGVHPQPASVRFLSRLPPMLDLSDQGYSDEDLLALAAALPLHQQDAKVEAIDLGGNPRLSDAAVCVVMEIFAVRCSKTLRSLRFSYCHRLGKQTLLLCTGLLSESLHKLQILDVSGISITMQEYVELANAIEVHCHLREIRLAQTGLGATDKASAAKIVKRIVANPWIRRLELGWNLLDAVAFETLGKGIVERRNVQSLGLANTAPCTDPTLNGSPLLILLELLARDRAITMLDISNNVLNGEATLVLEAAVRRHPIMQRIDISKNPLGVEGIRPLLRLVAHQECRELGAIVAEDCGAGSSNANLPSPYDVDPSGTYSLEMGHPAERALLKLLLMRFCDGPEALGPMSSFIRSATLRHRGGGESVFSFDNMKKGKEGAWEVPTRGRLSFQLSVGEAVLGAVAASHVATSAIDRIVGRTRISLGTDRKTLAILALIKDASTELKSELLKAVSFDFELKPEHIKALCVSGSASASCDPVAVCQQLAPCLLGSHRVRSTFLGCTTTVSELCRIEQACSKLLTLNLENPTGRYELHLAEPSDRCVAERLLVLNRWQYFLWRAAGRMDITEHGNAKNLRNESLNGREFHRAADDWRLPLGGGVLKFDFVALSRPPHDAAAIDAKAWAEVLAMLKQVLHSQEVAVENRLPDGDLTAMPRLHTINPRQRLRKVEVEKANTGAADGTSTLLLKQAVDALCGKIKACLTEEEVLAALALVSAKFWLSSWQLRELLCVFHHAMIRCDMFVLFFFRLMDWPLNGKICRPKFAIEDWTALMKRLGYINLFLYFQPEGMSCNLDLSVYEQRKFLHMSLRLANSEHPTNLKKPRIDWTGSGKWDNFVAGIPNSWDDFNSIPAKGVFQATYFCSRESVRSKIRRRLAIGVGGWSFPPEAPGQDPLNHIRWWSVLDEVPEMVVKVMVFILQHFKYSFSDCFAHCDTNHDGKLNNNEFVRSLREVGCLKGCLHSTSDDDFERQQLSHITGVFRFLDTTNDGDISLKEFSIFDSIWRELWTSMTEFKTYVKECFSKLELAWEFADNCERGEISFSEFCKLAQTIHFDGPIREIFWYLDANSDDHISRIEWQLLEGIEQRVQKPHL